MEEFQQELIRIQDGYELSNFLNKYVFHGTPFVFKDRERDYFDFRHMIAKQFNVHYTKIFIVGSAKLGFSYHKETIFSLESDIDVVIVDEDLFNYYYEKISDVQYALEKQSTIMTQLEESQFNKFKSYLIKGWLRPDMLPHQLQIETIKNDWFDFFRSISSDRTSVGNYKVSAGLFKNYNLLEKYYLIGLQAKKHDLEMRNINNEIS